MIIIKYDTRQLFHVEPFPPPSFYFKMKIENLCLRFCKDVANSIVRSEVTKL